MAARRVRGRPNQRRRTRQDLLNAAARLLKQGATPTIEAVAEAAMVSRATAYRYFPTLDALLVEAPLEDEVPNPEVMFAGIRSTAPEERIDAAEASLHEMVYRNESQLRRLLASSLSRAAGADGAVPVRQNRRSPLIHAALAPIRSRLGKSQYDRLCAALAVYFGPEAMVVFRDVLQFDAIQARKVKSWAVRALVRSALKDARRN
ncbi:MAG: TetR/AcrR family transcriptional regulator [Betaproteobacteria bacterium]